VERILGENTKMSRRKVTIRSKKRGEEIRVYVGWVVWRRGSASRGYLS